MIDTSQPFVLLDDARNAGAAPSRLYEAPLEVIEARNAQELDVVLDRLADGGNWAGFMGYEAGHALEPRLAEHCTSPHLPLAWFARFAGWREVPPEDVAALLPDPEGGWVGTPQPAITAQDYAGALARVQALITAGDIYQANLTIEARAACAGHPLAIYAGLRRRALAGYGGVVWTGQDWLLSCSPELFFALQGRRITTKPMKGTALRDADDAAAIATLRNDPKQRAENLMIVDLLRNDLSRVAEPGTVDVPHLFTVETYPTIHTMTSTVTAQLADGLGSGDVLRAIFPCGSITGAPKIRAMEVIHEVEARARGIYTGSIGRVDANGDTAFNVAIRTLHLGGEGGQAVLGLGGGIVADSKLADEWRECLAKGRFVGDPRRFDLIETMRFEPEAGIPLLERHLERMKESARALGFAFDRHAARNELQAATFLLDAPSRVRLMLAASGQFAIQTGPLPPVPEGPVAVALAPHPLFDPHDMRLRHKTSLRDFWTRSRAAGAWETLFVDAQGFLTEGSFTSLFVERDGMLVTPPLARGLLPGVLRGDLLATGRAVEGDLLTADLAGGFLLGNALRGLVEARLG